MSEINNSNFNWKSYIDNYQDIQKKGIYNRDNAYQHYLEIGIKGNRSSESIYRYSNNGKILILISAHTRSILYFYALINNIILLRQSNNHSIDIIVINSIEFKDQFPFHILERYDIKFHYVENTKYLDFGKWVEALSITEFRSYNHVLFINDSIMLTTNINQYINNLVRKNSEYYGFTNNNQIRSHYQSYLFSLRADCIAILLSLFYCFQDKINTYDDIVEFYETRLYHVFDNKDLYINEINNQVDIFYFNDYDYIRLLYSDTLPIIKMKRLIKESEYVKENSFYVENNQLKSINHFKSAILTRMNHIQIDIPFQWINISCN